MSIVARLKKDAPPPHEPPQGREDLVYWHAQLAEAIADVTDHEAGVARLMASIESGSAAEAGAVGSLLASRGKPPGRSETIDVDYKIAHGRIASKALAPAEEQLSIARAEVDRLRTEVVAAAKRALLQEAVAVVDEYDRKLSEVHAVYDRLLGIRGALFGEASFRPIEAPRFRLVPGAEIAIDIHGSVNTNGDPRRTTLQATEDWMRALDKLVADPAADLSDLLE